MKFIFFPGLGADSRLGEFHRIEGAQCAWIDWPELERMTDMESLAEHATTCCSITAGSVLIGISFGGLVAQEVARRTGARGVVLISSFRVSSEIALMPRALGATLPAVPSALFNVNLAPDFFMRYYFGVRERAHIDLVRDMNAALGPARIKRLCRIALEHGEPIPLECPVLRVHGSHDRLIPFRERPAGDAAGRDVVIKGGGHLLSFTHADEVNRAIREFAKRPG